MIIEPWVMMIRVDVNRFDVFHQACEDLGPIAEAAGPDPVSFADQVYEALLNNGYGQYDDLIQLLATALANPGLEHLKQRLVSLSEEPFPDVEEDERQVIGWGLNGPVYEDSRREQHRLNLVSMALSQIADAQGDVDAYIAQFGDKARSSPAVAADIAGRLLDAGRAEEAWEAINAAGSDRRGYIPYEWEEKRAEILDALGRNPEAQAFRWACFEHSLSDAHLRAYLKRLPDFDDIEAEERALEHVSRVATLYQALHFLLRWPSLEKMAHLVLSRAEEIDGNHYEVLTPAADALTEFPLAATLLRRSMIEFALDNARAKRYPHAARHLLECESLVGLIDDFQRFETHEAFLERLKADHGRKTGFWNLFD